MFDTTRLKEVEKNYNDIAEMHKAELESTSAMPNWNNFYFQLIKLQVSFSKQSDQEQLQKEVKALLLGTFKGMKAEISKLVPETQHITAMALYAKIENELHGLISDLNNTPGRKRSM